MTVYIVVNNELYEGGQPVAVFSTKELAEAWRNAGEGGGYNWRWHDTRIEEWQVDDGASYAQ